MNLFVLSLLNFCYLWFFLLQNKYFQIRIHKKISHITKNLRTYRLAICMAIRIANLYDYTNSYGLAIRMVYTDQQSIWTIQIADLYVRKRNFCTPLLFRWWKLTKIHRILLTNACTSLETKYASKPPLTKSTYTKWWKFCEKKNSAAEIKNWTCYL